LENLIHTTAILFRQQTGQTPSVTRDESKHRYSGQFLNFFEVCCRAFAPKYAAKGNMALGKAVQRALKTLPASY
jgi:hypothetical protein